MAGRGRAPAMRRRGGDGGSDRSDAPAGSKDLQAPRWLGAKPGKGRPILAGISCNRPLVYI